MRSVRKILSGVLLALTLGPVALPASTAAVAGQVDARLGELASRAKDRSAWESLRRYAKTAKSREQQGQAYFALGYREYDAGAYAPAMEDLRASAETHFTLTDFAEYYAAAASQQADQPGQVADILRGFSTRFPESSLRLEALQLLANALLLSGQVEEALQALSAEPLAQQRAPLALLTAQAYEQSQKLTEAARAYQDVYYSFATAPESNVAAEALRRLEARLGSSYPAPSEQTQLRRAEALFKSARFSEALKEYDALLQADPSSPLAGEWKLARVRCLLRLKRYREAIDGLSGPSWSDPDLDAERLELLVEANSRADDEVAMLAALDHLFQAYPQSPFYASALSAAARCFVLRLDWLAAARYYQPLVEKFPESDLAPEANWRVAWAEVLRAQLTIDTRQPVLQNSDSEQQPGQINPIQEARQALADHILRYPMSPHVPAALYWLGRLAEQSGPTSEAEETYSLLERRFVNNYYAIEAGKRMRALQPRARTGAETRGVADASALSRLPDEIPPAKPPAVQLCSTTPAAALQPFLTLQALSLNDLAEQYLRTELSEQPGAPDVLLALCRFQAKQEKYEAAIFNAKKLVPNYPDYPFSELPRETWDLLYPQAFWKLVQREARANKLDAYLVMGLIRQESGFDPKATSAANARGLMQMLPETAAARSGGQGHGRARVATAGRKLYDPAYNVRMSCRYLRDLIRFFDGSLEEALAAYNAGDTRVKQWLSGASFSEPSAFVESIPFGETRLYVEQVLRDAVIYRRLMSGTAKFRRCG